MARVYASKEWHRTAESYVPKRRAPIEITGLTAYHIYDLRKANHVAAFGDYVP